MALSSQNSGALSLPPVNSSLSPTSTLHADNSLNAAQQIALDAAIAGQQEDCRQQAAEWDVDGDGDATRSREEGVNQSTNARVRDAGEESNYGDDEKGSAVETESVDYGDGESEVMREGVRDGSVSPSFCSLRVEPDLEDSQSHLRLEEIFEGDGSTTESDVNLANLSDPFAAGELELIERALQSLQNIHKQGRQEVPDSASADGDLEAPEVDERGPPSPDYPRDVDGVSRLLRKVQAVRAQRRNALLPRRRSISRDNNRSPRPRSVSTAGDQDMDFADMRQVVKAASKAAFAAAKAAEAAVNAVEKNSEAIQELCKTLTSKDTEHVVGNQMEGSSQTNQLLKIERRELDIELRQAEISKKLMKQNKLTHWVLGFMIVSSFAWRYGVVKFVRRVNNAVSNPFQGITDVFDNFKGEKKEKSSKLKKSRAGLNLPSILPSDSDEEKDGELPFNLGKILPHRETDDEAHGSAHTNNTNNGDGESLFNLGKLLPQKETDVEISESSRVHMDRKNGPFNLAKILPGVGDDRAEDE